MRIVSLPNNLKQLYNLRKKGNHRRGQLQEYQELPNLMRKDRWKKNMCAEKNALSRERILVLFSWHLSLSMCCFSLQYLDSSFLSDS